MTTLCEPVDGVIHNLCTTAGYDFSLQLQNLNSDGTVIPIPLGSVISGSVKETVNSTSIEIDLTPFLTITDYANGLIAWSMPGSATDAYKTSGFEGVYQISLNDGGVHTIYIDNESCFIVKKDVQNGPVIPVGNTTPPIEGSFGWTTGLNLVDPSSTFWNFDPNLPQTLLLSEGFDLNPADTTEIICNIAGRYLILPGGGQGNTTPNQNYSINYFTINGVTQVDGTLPMAPLGGAALSFSKIVNLEIGDVIKVISNDFPIGLPSGSHGSTLFGRSLSIIKG